MTKTLKTVTLGCKVNQYESEYLRQGFERLGYRKPLDGEPIDLCIVNTCTVTAESEAKCRKIIRRLAKAHPEAEIIVTGCFATRAPDEAAALPNVVDVIADKRRLPDLLARRGLVDIPTGIACFDSRRRAYVKIQDGCRMNCSYCIVPTVRSHLSSRPPDEILDEVRRLLAAGHREIVLTGVHLGAYGKGEGGRRKAEAGDQSSNLQISKSPNPDSPFRLPPSSLPSLLRRLASLPGDFRVRLSSIEAAEVTPELISVMADCPDRFCRHLHLPLQSGSDVVLRRMNRRGTSRQFIERCREIQAALDQPAVTTDVIVGFPGETEDDFAATCRVVEEVGFAKVHVFRFSPRQGTPAAEMDDQVQNSIAMHRANRLAELAKPLRLRFLQQLLGQPLQVLVEMPLPNHPGWMAGTCDRHAPVAVPGGRELIGQFVNAVGRRVDFGCVFAE